MRKSLRLRGWQKGQDLVRQWETEGQLIEKPKALTVKEACDKFLADAEARNLREPTLYKYRLLFRQLQEFAALHGLAHISDFDVDWVHRFRSSWTNRNIAARKKLEAFRAFFRFVHESGWIPTNPASYLKPLGSQSHQPHRSREKKSQAFSRLATIILTKKTPCDCAPLSCSYGTVGFAFVTP